MELNRNIKRLRGLYCECLIDQGRYIGDDSVGYACSNRVTKKATSEYGTFYLCDSCFELLSKDPLRITYMFTKEDEEQNAQTNDNS